MGNFKVVLEVMMTGEDPLQVAKKFDTWRRNPNIEFNKYSIQDTKTGKLFAVNVTADDEHAVTPLSEYNPYIKMDERNQTIERIKEILVTWGATTSKDQELDTSPCLYTSGDMRQLIEEFYPKCVIAVTYRDNEEVDEEQIEYEELPDDILYEIEQILEDYDAEQYKTFKRVT